MIHEIASFAVKADQIDSFKRAFGEVAHLLSCANGYEGHQLMQGIEDPSHFNLIVQWRSLEDHTQGFGASADHELFISGLQVCLAAEPSVHHVRMVESTNESGLFSA